MGDIIIPKKTFGSFMLGVMVVLIVLFAFGVVMAASVFNADGGTISNLGSPVASSDAATKGYVDASSLTPGNWTCTRRANSCSSCMSVFASCTGDEKVITGGCGSNSDNGIPIDQGWFCSGTMGSHYAYANCCT